MWLAGKSAKQPAATSQQQQQQQVPCLWGTLRYEDCVEDEWYIAWLLRQVTAALPATAVRLWDDDGEFQLIEVQQLNWVVQGRVQGRV